MRKTLGIGLGLFAAAITLGAFLSQRQIGQFLFDRVIERSVGNDRTAALPDGLHAYVCGSGSPMPDAQRAGPCIGVLAGERAFIFDAGSGSIRKLGRMGFPMDRLDAAFLTHLHSDHIDGVGELMMQAWMAGGRSEPLPIHGPPGTERVVAGFEEAYFIDRGYRIAHHGGEVARPGGFGGQPIIIAPPQGIVTVYNADGVRIDAIGLDHSPVDNAYAYRIAYKSRIIVLSGDTKRSETLASFSQGADVLFHDALSPQMVGKIGKALARSGDAGGAKIMADIPDYHTSPEDAARVAQQANVDTLVLYHLVPAPPTALVGKAFLGEAESLFDGEMRLAEDGMLVTLPAGSEAIDFNEAL